MSVDLYRPHLPGPVKYGSFSASTAADNAMVAAVPQSKIRLLSANLIAAGTVAVTFKSAANALSGAWPLTAQGQINLPPCPWGHLETAEGEALNLGMAQAIGVTGSFTYVEVPTGPA